MNKRQMVKSLLWLLIGFGATSGFLRLVHGLGATTGLSDATPWGFWIGFDVMAGVALAAGGFTMAAVVYVFGLEQFRPIVRPAVLTAFLGYVIVAIGLMMDLGLPWNIWHPMVFWQYRSVLFEVGTCVTLYLTVLALEVAPIVLEHPLFSHPIFHKAYKILKHLSLPLVILGIMLSTLHQSSLGSLFLIMPFRVHELWYTSNIYILYFISAAGLGCAMVIFESTLTSLIYDHKPRQELMQKLGKIASVILGVYLVFRIGDLLVKGKLGVAFNGTGTSTLFIVEILISTIIPSIFFNWKKINGNTKGLFWTAAMVVFGFIMNRQNIFLTMSKKGPAYFPWVSELMISLALVAGATMVFIFFVEHFDLFGDGAPDNKKEIGEKLITGPFFGADRSFVKGVAIFTAPVIAGVGLALMLLPSSAIKGYQYPNTPVKDAVGWDTLSIDGNRALESVLFPHAQHQQMMGVSRDSCMTCHHMSRPKDGPTSCSECHQDMYLATSIFSHGYHQTLMGGNKSCDSCHVNTKAKAEVLSCNTAECHKLLPSDTTSYLADSYVDAMHKKCKDCHEEQAKQADGFIAMGEQAKADSVKALGYCTACHPGLPPESKVRLSVTR
ncbi:MAG: Ni/Fe-hydrogenase cytochrome b subunit [Fibrobacteria bacterium]|nr:Ni/Fe-hydrogenase cytochrome b subunit [Fibrobacteria bacterium]